MGDEHDIIRRAAALERGVSDREIRRLCGRGHWHRVHRGAYLPAESYSQLDEYGRHHRRAVAVAEVDGPAAGLDLVDALDLDRYHLWHAVRADLLRRLGRLPEAAAAYDAALARATNAAERGFLQRRRAELS